MTSALFVDIATKGSYYYPASKHYNVLTRVQCDRCRQTNLPACIGYQNADLCLKCADEVMRDFMVRQPSCRPNKGDLTPEMMEAAKKHNDEWEDRLRQERESYDGPYEWLNGSIN